MVGSAVACSKECYGCGAYNDLMQEMTVEDPQQFRIFTRMSAASNSEDILRVVGPIIAKTDTNMREAVSALFAEFGRPPSRHRFS